ncbi:MAG: hypothetical protein JWM98_1815 [Thermoleophilia bacterium]|nr:hypothetical protein [Thermoleophilia bacterium]
MSLNQPPGASRHFEPIDQPVHIYAPSGRVMWTVMPPGDRPVIIMAR